MTLSDFLKLKIVTQQELAEIVGVSNSAISMIASGKKGASLSVALAIEDATGRRVLAREIHDVRQNYLKQEALKLAEAEEEKG